MRASTHFKISAGGGSYEPETVALMASIGWADDATPSPHGSLTYSQVYGVVDNYFKSGKADGWLSLMKAVYLFIGNNASTHKWNAVNPQDTNAAYRMTFFGSGVHSATGFLGNGTNAYGNTNFSPANNPIGNESYGYYLRTEPTAFSVEMGSIEGGSGASVITKLSNTIYVRSQGSEVNAGSNTNALGLTTVSRVNTSEFIRDTRTLRNTITNTGNRNVGMGVFYVAALNNTNVADYFSQCEFSYAFIGEGLIEAQITSHKNAVQQLQTDLGRQV